MNPREATQAKRRSPYLAVIGLLIAVVVGVIAWMVAPAVLDSLAGLLPTLRSADLSQGVVRLVFTLIVVLLAVIVFGLAAALTAPKNEQSVSHAQVERDRDRLWRQQKAERDRHRKPKGSR